MKGGVIDKAKNVVLYVANNGITIPKYENKVQEIWEKEKKRLGDSLFDGDVVCYHGYEKRGDTINVFGAITKYRYVVAKRLAPELNIVATVVGTTGASIIREDGNEYVVFAKRRENVFLAPGAIEVVPSGVVDEKVLRQDGTADYVKLLYTEFEEETLLKSACIEDTKGWVLIYDEMIDSCDICCVLYLNCTRKEMKKAMLESTEYAIPEFIDIRELKDYIEENKKRMTRLSYYFSDYIYNKGI